MRPLLVALLLVVMWPVSMSASPWPLSDFEIGPACGEQLEQSVVAGAGGFLAAWQDRRAGSSIRATRLDETGAVLDPRGILVWPRATDPETFEQFSGPEVVWTGRFWLVIFVSSSELGVARILPGSGSLDGPITWHRYAATVDFARVSASMVGDRVFVALNGGSSSSFMLLDDSGSLVVPPQSLRSTLWIFKPIVVADGNDAVLLDFGADGMVSYRISREGVVVGPTTLGQPAEPGNCNLVVSHGEGFLFVRQRLGIVEAWTLAPDARFVLAHTIVSAAPDSYTWVDDGVALLPATSGTDILYLTAASSNPADKVIRRATMRLDGTLDHPTFEVKERANWGLAAASTSSRTVLVTAPVRGGWESDLVGRAASTLDEIPAATQFDLALSAPAQMNALVVRNGVETLVSWEEPRDTGDVTVVHATTIGVNGRESEPIVLFETDVDLYSIAGDGHGDYLVARRLGDVLQLRTLGPGLAWIDAEWTTVEGTPDYLIVGEKGIVWDGEAWWVGWFRWNRSGNGTGSRNVRRFGRDLAPLTAIVDVEITAPTTPTLPQLVAASGHVLVFWLHDPHPCFFPICDVPTQWLLATSVDRSGAIVRRETLLVSNVTSMEVSIASNGAVLLAAWAAGADLEGTRITFALDALDTASTNGWRAGSRLDASSPLPTELAWDGENWLAIHGQDYDGDGRLDRVTFRRFSPSGELASSWRAAATRDLGSGDETQWNGGGLIAAGSGEPTLVLQQIVNPETTDVIRYFVRNMSDFSGRRGTRR